MEDVLKNQTNNHPRCRGWRSGSYEGLVAEDAASPYRAGPTLAWLKVKVPKYREGERGWEIRATGSG